MDLTAFAFARNVSQHGSEVRMCCPFHRESNPSFYFNTETELWNCFRCRESGQGYRHLLERLGYSHEEALQRMPLLVDSDKEEETTSVYEQDLALARQMYDEPEDWNVASPERGYLYGRFFLRDTLKRWRVRILQGVERKSIFIPLFFHGFVDGVYQEIVYGWQRRSANEWEKPKYDTMKGLKKSHYLYGHFGHGKILVVCEGVTDVWMCSQREIRAVVATLGSCPSQEQWALMQRAEAIICAYDHDTAGTQGYEILRRMCEDRFITRLDLTTDVATSSRADFEAAIQKVYREYTDWKKGAVLAR